MINEVIIPAAGLGTRMYPVTNQKISKLMLKVKDKPIISYAIEEAFSSGFNRIYIIVNEQDQELINFLKNNYKDVNIIITETTKGTAQSILKAEKFISNAFFAVLLPDILIKSEKPALFQMKNIFENMNSNVLGWLQLSEQEKPFFGTTTDILLKKINNSLYEVRELLPKNIQKTEHYIVRYIVSKTFFKLVKDKGITDDSGVLREMIKTENFFGININGKGFDLGNPQGYKYAAKFF